MFTSLKEIQAYIEEWEQKRLDLNNEEVWSKAYLPAKRRTEVQGNYEGKVVFKHVQIRLVASNEPLMGCGRLPDWLKDKRCIYALGTFDDNLCIWRCLVIYERLSRGEKNRVQERNCDAAKNLAYEYYCDKNLKKRDVRPTKLDDFEGIARHHNVNIMLHEPKKERGKDVGCIWQLVYGKAQHKSNLPTINMGLHGGRCFYIKKIDVLCKQWECKGCRQIFTRNENLIRHLKDEKCTGGKTKIICSGGKFKHILNSFEKVLTPNGGDTNFSYNACQCTEAQARERGKYIHHKMCGHGGERMVTVWTLNDKGKKEPTSFLVDGYEPKTNTVY